MKTSWGKPVHVIAFIRTLMITFAVAVCLATLMGCGNSPEKNTSPVAEALPGADASLADDIETMRKAAEAGDAVAQYNFGFIYYYGQGVPQDDAEALKWWRKAAEQGVAEAQYNLGSRYQNGWGVPEDYVVAYAWYSVAATSGNDFARMDRDSIKRELTPSQVEKGEAMATEISERIEKRKAASAE